MLPNPEERKRMRAEKAAQRAEKQRKGLRIRLIVAAVVVLLCGCGVEETLETVADEWVVPVMAQPREVSLRLPEELAMPVLEVEDRKLYLAEDYEIMLETIASGDLDATIRSLTGYGSDRLTVIRTGYHDTDRYDFVWSAAGESGERLGRGAILDDGTKLEVKDLLCFAEDVHNMY